MKAFLSHSSCDKELVRAVAVELGRQYCLFDEQVFDTGIDFKRSIEKSFDDTSIFVLFASKAALASDWVNVEIEEAWYKKLQRTLDMSLVYIIDSSISFQDLPKWLTRGKILRENSAKVIARDIRFHLNEAMLERQRPFFVGRKTEIEALESALIPPPPSFAPHILFITGLPGIGRRTLIQNVAPHILSFKKFVEIRIGEGDEIKDLCIKIADIFEPYNTREGFEQLTKEIQMLSEDDAKQRILRNLRGLCNRGDLPILYDDGGLITSTGKINAAINSILREVAPNDEAYIFLVSTRRPSLGVTELLPIVPVFDLPNTESKRLLNMLLNKAGKRIRSSELEDLAEFIAGYPPAAYYAVQQINSYGVELVLKDKENLIKFRTGVFLSHLDQLSKNIGEVERSALQLLGMFSPLPLEAIAKVLNKEQYELHRIMINLIDLSLLRISGEGLYRLAEPILDVVPGVFGRPTKEVSSSVVKALHDILSNTELQWSRLELSRVLFRAAYIAGDEASQKSAFHLANDLIVLTETLYHERDYEECIRCARLALNQRAESLRTREFLIRALAQEELWQEVNSELQIFATRAEDKDLHYLKGFLERKQNNINQAIIEYEEAERLGRTGAAITRELAYCYFFQGDFPKASSYIKFAINKIGDNKYLIDLWAKIAQCQHDEESANQALNRLAVVGDVSYYNHRLSTVRFAFGDYNQAYDAALKAFRSIEKVPFEIIYQLVKCEIKLKYLKQASEHLDTLDRQFNKTRKDGRTILHCMLEIEKGNYKEALMRLEMMRDKNTLSYKIVRRDALAGETQKTALPDNLRLQYNQELASLREALKSYGFTRYSFPDLNI